MSFKKNRGAKEKNDMQLQLPILNALESNNVKHSCESESLISISLNLTI